MPNGKMIGILRRFENGVYFIRNLICSKNYQLLDEVEQNIVICRWRADQLFADAEGRGK